MTSIAMFLLSDDMAREWGVGQRTPGGNTSPDVHEMVAGCATHALTAASPPSCVLVLCACAQSLFCILGVGGSVFFWDASAVP